MELQDMAELAAEYVNTTHRHLFLTGKAGTGKTTFLRHIQAQTYKRAVVAAPTGIAAINAGGVTLHALLQLPFGPFVPDNNSLTSAGIPINTPQTLATKSRFNATKRALIQEIELLIIDEVSMLRADLLDAIDETLRRLRKNNQPFGGVQILFIGDLMQLPPVVKDDERQLLDRYYPSPYFFHAHALRDAPPIQVELDKIFRQQDPTFIDLLNRLRHNAQTEEDLLFLNRYFNPDFNQNEETGFIHLTTHNYRADKINQMRLQQIENEVQVFPAIIEGDFPENTHPAPRELILKEGAQVMFIKNDPSGEGQFFNGKIGTVSNLSQEDIWVQFENGDEVQVAPYRWENKRYTLNQVTNEVEEKLLGTFDQFPLKLAWAVTVHKSQGLTFEKAILDLSGTFAPGQLYVALSRLTSLKGLVLSSPLPESPPEIDQSLTDFTSRFSSREVLKDQLFECQAEYLREQVSSVMSWQSVLVGWQKQLGSFHQDDRRSLKQQFLPWTREQLIILTELSEVAGRFAQQVVQILRTPNDLPHLDERMGKASNYFSERLAGLRDAIRDHRKVVTKMSGTKAYLKDLEQLHQQLMKKRKDLARLALFITTLSKGQSFSRQEWHDSEAFRQLQQETEKKDTRPTAEISYQLFREGKGIEDIAIARNLAPTTIEGHLASYVERGEIALEELVIGEKIRQITLAAEQPHEGLKDLKAILSDEISYGEIKMVLAHLNRGK